MPKLYLIGLGLFDEKDITIRGLEAVRSSKRVFLESYTSALGVSVAALETLYERKVELLYREDVESGIDKLLKELAASDESYALCVIGDPFGATTHADLFLRACALGVDVVTVHNASVLTAVGATGLQLYRFGATLSIPFFTDGWRPYSFARGLAQNRAAGLHTLLLLDIRVREPTPASLFRERKAYEPARFMTVAEAVAQLEETVAAEAPELGAAGALRGFGVARLGAPDQRLASGTLAELAKAELGPPLHSLIVCAPELHSVEESFFALFRV